MDDYDMNSLELTDSPPDYIQMLMLQAPQVSLPRPFQDYTYMNDPFPDEAFAVMPEDDPHSLQEAQEAADWPEWERASHADFFQSNETLPPQHQSHTGQLPFPAGGDPSGVPDPSEYIMWGDQPDNVTPPPQPHSHTGQQPFVPGEDPTRVLDSFEFNMLGDQHAPPPPHPTQVETSPVQGDDGPEHDSPEFVASPPVQDQAAELAAPADTASGTSKYPCPICRRKFKRSPERDRHLRSFLPPWIYCSIPDCSFRFNRRENLVSHWRREHAGSGQPPQKQQRAQYQIYDPEPLVTWIVSGQMSMELAESIALSEVEARAQELGKGVVWEGNWFGRRRRPHTDEH